MDLSPCKGRGKANGTSPNSPSQKAWPKVAVSSKCYQNICLQPAQKPKQSQQHHMLHPLLPFKSSFFEANNKGGCLFDFTEGLFHYFPPLNKNHLCPFAGVFFCNLRSVCLFWRLWIEHCEFLWKRHSLYCGAC